MQHMRMRMHVQRNRGAMHTSFTEANTGRPRCKVPAFFGLTPPTMFVPYSMACSLWKVPVLPVKPWQITLVCLKTAGGGTLACEPEAQRRVLSAGREVDACVLAAAAHRHMPRELPQRQRTMPLRREHG